MYYPIFIFKGFLVFLFALQEGLLRGVITLNPLVVWPEITLPTCGLKSVTLPT